MKDLYECDNCSRTDVRDEFLDAQNLSERLTPGFIYTDKECPECFALAFPVKPETEKK